MGKQKPENRATLGRAELELLQFVDANPAISVGDAVTQFGTPRGLARTTVLTMMQRLVTKGFLKRQQIDNVYRYSTKVSAATAVTEMVSEFVRGVLGGSVSPFVAYLSAADDLTDEEVVELRSLVQGLDQRSKKKSNPKSSHGEG